MFHSPDNCEEELHRPSFLKRNDLHRFLDLDLISHLCTQSMQCPSFYRSVHHTAPPEASTDLSQVGPSQAFSLYLHCLVHGIQGRRFIYRRNQASVSSVGLHIAA